MEIIGHRGSSFTAPENTMASLRLAWEEQADGVEIDVQLTRDRHVVVLHDAGLSRTAGMKAMVKRKTLKEVQALDAGSWKGRSWKGLKIPTLAEVSSALPSGKCLFVEIKCGPEIILPIQACWQACPVKPEQVHFVGFSLCTMMAVKEAFPAHSVFWNISLKQEGGSNRWIPSADQLAEALSHAGLNGLGIEMSPGVEAGFIGRLKHHGIPLFMWTVDDPAIARWMGGLDVEYLCTNRPGWLRDQVENRQAIPSLQP